MTMGYLADVSRVVAANIDELKGDLDHARHALLRARHDVDQLERQVASLEALLELASDRETSEGNSLRLTLHDAMVAVLRSTPGGRLRAGDLAEAIERRGLYRMRDGRPVEAQQIHARVGHYPHLFAKEGTYIKLADERPH
jgi:hypothetical protein